MGEIYGLVSKYGGQVLQSLSGWAGRCKISRNGSDMQAAAGFPIVFVVGRLKKEIMRLWDAAVIIASWLSSIQSTVM